MPKHLTATLSAAFAVMLLGLPASALAHWGSPVSLATSGAVEVAVDANGDLFAARILGGGIEEFDPSVAFWQPMPLNPGDSAAQALRSEF